MTRHHRARIPVPVGAGTVDVVGVEVKCGDRQGEIDEFGDDAPRTDLRAQVISHTTGRWAFSLGWHAGRGAPSPDPDATTDTGADGG
ncbi:hypothetical protein [Streptacidiphilus anmyonensis]|uniref:hypothetical protein n=1 Tax=Streptacidiphilus anmyonensis TaxID=405782 RepID=UPI0005AB0E4B|nr:hypothetical protein [Streptacidiphilus anmyonensis]